MKAQNAIQDLSEGRLSAAQWKDFSRHAAVVAWKRYMNDESRLMEVGHRKDDLGENTISLAFTIKCP